MFLMFLNRTDLLRMLPQGAVIAEIGTAEGDYAAQILEIAKPRQLHLIDPWDHQERADYKNDPNNVPQAEADARYAAIRAKFAAPIATGQVVVHRAYSPAVTTEVPDGYFDFVYVDGLHSHDAVLADLHGFDRKVKPDGLILGHDYTTHSVYRAMGFGVVEAVNEFVIATGYEFLFLTYEGSPTYVLAKNPASPMRNQLVTNVMRSVMAIVEIPEAERRTMSCTDVFGPDRKPFRQIIGFR